MRAVQINSYGGVEVLDLVDIPKPEPQKDRVLIEVYAASINPFDWKIRAGYLKENIPLQFPVAMGGDFAGVVVETGEEVYGSSLILNGGSGAFAEFTLAKPSKMAKKPKSINFEEAASLPVVGSSAVQALEDHMKLQKGQKILIHGGAGGIGSIAIQLAKSIGAYVTTTVSTNDKEFVKELGADEIIDYKHEKFEQKLKDFNAVFDTVGGETTNRSFEVLKRGGILVSMLGQPDPELAKRYGITGIGQGTDTNTKHLSRLAELVDNGKIKPQIDKVFPLDQIKEAFKHLEEGSPRGKVVLKIRD